MPGAVEATTPARPDRNLAMELVRVTEYGALAAARWVGLGEKDRFLTLVVTDGGDGVQGDWVMWGDARVTVGEGVTP